MLKKISLCFFVFLLLACSEQPSNEVTIVETVSPITETSQSIEYPEHQATDTISFYAIDGLRITADLYMIDETSPIFILFHRSGWSRGEYINTALSFNELGFNVMAVDLRSGMTSNGILNKTAISATESGYATNLEDAVLDVEASIEYVIQMYDTDIYLLGSASSASLVLIAGQPYADVINGIFAFSPGEYFEYHGLSISEHVSTLTIPVFITSASYEIDEWQTIFEAVASEMKLAFYPEGFGQHGSESLWSTSKDNSEFWSAIEYFLELLKEDAN